MGNFWLGKKAYYLRYIIMSGWDAVQGKDAQAGTWVTMDAEGTELASGTDGLTGFKGALSEDGIIFGCIRVHGVDERDNVTSVRPKLVRVNWVGKKVKPMKKMGALQGKQKAAEIYNGAACEVDAEEEEEVSQQAIGSALLKSGAAHKPLRYEFDNGGADGDVILVADIKV